MNTPKPLELAFTLRCFEPPLQVAGPELDRFAAMLGLAEVAHGRISRLVLAQMLAYAHQFGIDPEMIAAEIKHLEGLDPGRGHGQTRPATPFNPKGRLAGLHHKHFTDSNVAMVATNILSEHHPNKLTRIVHEELANGATIESLQRLTDRVVHDAYDQRASDGRLTGEWIVYAELDGLNHYLCLATHSGGDAEVLGYLSTVSRHEFPKLLTQLPHLFN